MENETRELIALAMKENKRHLQENTSKELKKMTKQELHHHMLLEREVAHNKESTHQNSEQHKKIWKEKSSSSSEIKIQDKQIMQLSDESEESSSDSDDSSSDSSSSSDSDDSSSDDSDSTSTSSDDTSNYERKHKKITAKLSKLNKKRSNINSSPDSSDTCIDNDDKNKKNDTSSDERKHKKVTNKSSENEKKRSNKNLSPDSSDYDAREDVDRDDKNKDSTNISNMGANSEDNLDYDTPSTLSADHLAKSDKSNVSSPALNVETICAEEKMKTDDEKSELELMQDLPPYYPALEGMNKLL